MKKIIIMLLLAYSTTIYAQSINNIEALIQEGRYTEAAKQLRPLADRGNAEAQYLAAKLFFEGNGVNKSEVQGIKYAKLSAAQGNDNVAVMMLRIWRDTQSSTLRTAIAQVIKDYVKRFPSTKDNSKTWLLYAYYSLVGSRIPEWGFTTNEDLGWSIIENAKMTNVLEELGIKPKAYLDYVLGKSGYSSMIQYVNQQSYVSDFLLDVIVSDLKESSGSPLNDKYNPWYPMARDGNKYALYICAKRFYDYYKTQNDKYGLGSGYITLATSYSKKAYNAGIQKAKELADETENYHIGQMINHKGNIYKVYVVGNGFVGGYSAASKECRVLSRAEANQWVNQTGVHLPNNELVLKYLLAEVAKSGQDVSGGYWIINGVCEFDSKGNFIKFYLPQDVPARLGNRHKTYLIL